MLSERLTELRTMNGYTKKNIAELLNMTPEGYGHYESGNRKPNPETVIKLTKFYNVTSDYLLGITDSPFIPNELNDKAVAFHDGAFDGLDEADMEVLKDMAARLKELKEKK